MTLSLSEWAKYRDLLTKLSTKAADEFKDAVWKTGGRFNGAGLTAIPREDLIEYAHALVTKYSEGSAELACEMYDAMAKLSGKTLPPAVPAETASIKDVGRSLNSAINTSLNENYVSSVVGRFVKQASQDTTLQNAKRDGAEFAWIPSGDPCPFCIMLASNGWRTVSAKSLKNGHAEHIHSNCNCAYAVRFDSNTEVAGYNPDEYLEMYKDADGKKSKDKVNSMRRMQYQQNKDVIIAQKREAYAERKEAEFLRNNFPKGFIDDRVIGEPISKEELDLILKKAEENGIQFGRDGKNIEFDNYCGDPKILNEIIDEVVKEKNEHGIKKIILEYDNVLGFEGDLSKIDIGAFAETKGNTIRLNKYMFDDSNYLMSAYNEAVENRLFAKGTSYINVADHEIGHIISKKNPNLYNDVLRELQIKANNDNMSLEECIRNNISSYAGTLNKNDLFGELIPELNSMKNGSEGEFARLILERR